MSAAGARGKTNTQRIARYEIKAKAGEGASGVVYRAYDPLLDRDCAIKLARTNVMTEEEVAQVVAEFHHEARIAGKYPFDKQHTAFQILHQDPTPMSEYRTDIPPEVSVIVDRAMAKADADRFQSAAELARAIEAVVQQRCPGTDLLDTSHRYMKG